MRFVLVSLLSLLVGQTAFAYQFDLQKAGFGTYIRGEYGLAVRGDASYSDSSGTGVTFDGTRASEAGGEFGVLWSGTRTIFRLSAAILLPQRLSALNGSKASTQVYQLDSKVTAIIPQANFDFVVKQFQGGSRILASMGGGYAYVTTQNAYKMTTAGNAAYPSIADHTETGKGNGLDLQASVGFETEFADHCTIALDAGYRYLRVASLTSSGNVTTFTGTYADGDKLKNNNGSDRSLDLGGPFAGAAFRFYF